LTTIVTNSCGGKFGAPTLPLESNKLIINAEIDKVPSSLSANQMNAPALPGIFVGADGTSLLGPGEETKMSVSDSERHSFD
jgi:hypothetical protein